VILWEAPSVLARNQSGAPFAHRALFARRRKRSRPPWQLQMAWRGHALETWLPYLQRTVFSRGRVVGVCARPSMLGLARSPAFAAWLGAAPQLRRSTLPRALVCWASPRNQLRPNTDVWYIRTDHAGRAHARFRHF